MKTTTEIWKKNSLTVVFQQRYFLEKWEISEADILGWANLWSHGPGQGSKIPSFVLHDDKSGKQPDIVVELNGK